MMITKPNWAGRTLAGKSAAFAALAVCGLLGSAAVGGASAARAQGAAPAGCTGTASATWISIDVQGVRSAAGEIALTFYPDNSRRFLMRNSSLFVARVPAHAGTTHTCIFVPAPGVYAIAVYHDANGDHNLNRSGIGFPTEAYGFSNNPTTFVGLPAFRSVRLNIPRAGLNTHITLKYP